jgi:hypothetical protein
LKVAVPGGAFGPFGESAPLEAGAPGLIVVDPTGPNANPL